MIADAVSCIHGEKRTLFASQVEQDLPECITLGTCISTAMFSPYSWWMQDCSESKGLMNYRHRYHFIFFIEEMNFFFSSIQCALCYHCTNHRLRMIRESNPILCAYYSSHLSYSHCCEGRFELPTYRLGEHNFIRVTAYR